MPSGMKMRAVTVVLLAGMLACVFLLPVSTAKAATFNETVIYSFCSQPNCTDGASPVASLIDVNGVLYGTTGGGGAYNLGTAFALDPDTGAETVLHAFGRHKDGAAPAARLLNVNGTLYGTTISGGAYRWGTVFSLDPATGAETIVHSFGKGLDGALPAANLIEVNGLLYGTTGGGGNTGCGLDGCGTVFSVDPATGVENVLHAFCSRANCADGEGPNASLTAAKGMLYGTTGAGGANCMSDSPPGCGVVFAIDLKSGKEAVVYSFCGQANCADGGYPAAGVIDVKGTLYGTTSFGGVYGCQNMPPGCGTVFALDPGTGRETVLHSFGSGADGFHPYSDLIDVKGTLYGTTISGGSQHAGAAFSLDLSTGTEAVIWSFCGTNCFDPSSLIDVDGTLYGTTAGGGDTGYGMVFALEKEH